MPDFSRPAKVFTPLLGDEGIHRRAAAMAFSDDGRYLAVINHGRALVVYETGGWTERVRTEHSISLLPGMMWVPGRPVVTVKNMFGHGDDGQWAFDVDAGLETDVPDEAGTVRSRTGRYRAVHTLPGVKFVDTAGQPGPSVRLPPGLDPHKIRQVAFSADETRMFAVSDDEAVVTVIEAETGRSLGTIRTGDERVYDLAVSPDDRYLLLTLGVPGDTVREPSIWRIANGRPVMRSRLKGATLVAWSPDGRWLAVETEHDPDSPSRVHIFPVGLPDTPPAQFRPTGTGVDPAELD